MSTCERCNTRFTCAMADAADSTPCWCAQMPVLDRHAYAEDLAATSSSHCFCPACLQSLLARQQEGRRS